MKKVKVHSNSIRGKVLVVGDGLVLSFDEKGDAFCKESDLSQLAAYSRVRPGRIVVVKEEPKQAAPAPAPAPAPKKVEKVETKKAAKKVESKSTKDESDNTRRAPKKKAPKKSFFKKDEE